MRRGFAAKAGVFLSKFIPIIFGTRAGNMSAINCAYPAWFSAVTPHRFRFRVAA